MGVAEKGWTLWGWVPDLVEASPRREIDLVAAVARFDRAQLAGVPQAVATFRRAMRRVEALCRRHAPELRGVLRTLRAVRLALGLDYDRFGFDVGFDATIDHLVQMAASRRYRASPRAPEYLGVSSSRGRVLERRVARALALAARHVTTLARAARQVSVSFLFSPVRFLQTRRSV